MTDEEYLLKSLEHSIKVSELNIKFIQEKENFTEFKQGEIKGEYNSLNRLKAVLRLYRAKKCCQLPLEFIKKMENKEELPDHALEEMARNTIQQIFNVLDEKHDD